MRELLQVADIDFVARAPPTREVEELPYKLVMKALKNKIPAEQYMENMGMKKKKIGGELEEFREMLLSLKGSHSAILLDDNKKEIGRVETGKLIDIIGKKKPAIVVFDPA